MNNDLVVCDEPLGGGKERTNTKEEDESSKGSEGSRAEHGTLQVG